jgi:tetratricopeptide (TPR) repeat protein
MNPVVRLAGSLAAAIFALALASAPARADEIQDINRLLKQGQHAQALDRVNQYLAQKPRDAQGRFLKGVILTEQNKIPEAIDVFSKLSQDYPELPEPYNNLAVLYASQGQYEKARQQLEMSIRTHPSYATAYENLGDVYTKLASQAYDKALQLDSANPTAQNKLSLIREIMSNTTRPVSTPSGSAPSAPSSGPSPGAAPPGPAPSAPGTTSERPPAVAVAPKSSAPAAKSETATAPSSDEVLKAVQGWASAWSQKDVDTYLAFYATDFKPPRGESRAQWEQSRKQRISAPKRIHVAIQAPKVTVKGDSAVVSFRQHYESDALQSNSSKTLVMVRADGKWRIVEERVGS